MTDTGTAWGAIQPLVAAIVRDPAFEAAHPRGRDGRFLEKGGFVKYLDVVAGLYRRAQVEEFLADGRIKLKVSGTGEELVKHKSALYQVDPPKAVLDPKKWKAVGAQAGSNPGGFFEDPTGQKFYVKRPQSALHVGNENLANRLYGAAGAPTPQTAVSADRKSFITKIEKSVDWHTLSGQELEDAKEVAAKDFMVDCWLANWDAPANDNVRVTPDGVVLRVDSGGAVMFRARGGRRTLTPNVSEIQTLRDQRTSPGGANLYSKVTRVHEEEGTQRILAIHPDTIREMVKEEGLPDQTATELIARRAWLATHYGFQLPETTPEGIMLLDELKKSAAKQTAAETAKVAKVIQKLAPDAAVPLAKGAPVWVKNKTSGVSNPGDKVPDLMVVTALGSPDDPAASKFIWLSSLDGKIQYGNVPIGDVEILRENYASASAKYKGGEPPQLGDKVDQGAAGEGIVTAIYPLYMKVLGDDGKSRTGRIAKNALVQKVGTFEPTVAVTPNAAALDIGPNADVSNPESRFPVIAYSLPHRANVLVLSNDPGAGKSNVMLFDGRRANVPDSKLYDSEHIERAKVDAMPIKAPRVLGPRKAAVVDVTALPDLELAVNAKVKVDLKPGDRVLKFKQRSDMSFLVIRKDGSIEYAGSNKRGTGYDDKVDPNLKYNLHMINDILTNYQDPRDVTPPKYAAAADQLQAKTPNLEHFDKPKPLVVNAYDPAKMKAWQDANNGLPLYRAPQDQIMGGMRTMVKLEPGDRLTTYAWPGGPRVGLKDYYVDFTQPIPDDSWRTAPKIWLKRGGKTYDIGWSGENYNDQSKWVEISQTDAAGVADVTKTYWSNYYLTQRGVPEPTYTTSDGTVIKYTDVANQGAVGNAGQLTQDRQQLDLLNGSGIKVGYVGPSGLDGYSNYMMALSKTATGWDKGNPNPAPASSGARAYSNAELAAMPTGKTLKLHTVAPGTAMNLPASAIPVTDITVTKNSKGLWDRSDQPGIQAGNLFLINFELEDPSAPVPTAAPAAPIVNADIDQSDGFRSLSHKFTTTRKMIQDGGLDDKLEAIMDTEFQRQGYGGQIYKLPDGSEQGDPYMAMFVKAQDGDQPSLLLPNAAFNAVRSMTGLPILTRGVGTAQQRDAIKTGEHFNGTGVYGNGVYTAASASVAGNYGGNKVQVTPKPGAKGIENLEMYQQQTQDIASAMQDRIDTWSAGSGAPTAQEIETLDLLSDNVDQDIFQAAKDLWATRPTALQGSDYDDFMKSPQVKAGASYIAWLRGGVDDVKITDLGAKKTDRYYASTEGYNVGFTVSHADGSDGKIRMAFDPVWTSSGTGGARSSASKIDSKKYFSHRITAIETAKGQNPVKDRIGQHYNSGWFREHFTEALDSSGLGVKLSSNPDPILWADTRQKINKIDARISFISDPGRWAAAAGYDYFHVPTENYYIFTHRAGFIIKK